MTFHEVGAALSDADEREPGVGLCAQERVVEMFGEPVDALGDERGICHGNGCGDGIDGVERRAVGVRVCLCVRGRCRGGLFFGETVDVVVEQEHGHFHVISERVEPVSGTDGATVTVACDDEYGEVRSARANAASDGERAAVETVEAVSAHVVRES